MAYVLCFSCSHFESPSFLAFTLAKSSNFLESAETGSCGVQTSATAMMTNRTSQRVIRTDGKGNISSERNHLKSLLCLSYECGCLCHCVGLAPALRWSSDGNSTPSLFTESLESYNTWTTQLVSRRCYTVSTHAEATFKMFVFIRFAHQMWLWRVTFEEISSRDNGQRWTESFPPTDSFFQTTSSPSNPLPTTRHWTVMSRRYI